MDPVTAVGLASGILTFVEAGLKLVKIAHEIHNSVDGVLGENKHRESVADEVKKAASRLETTGNSSLTPERQALCDLAKKCREASTELITALHKVKPKPGSSNTFKSIKYAVKANRRVDEIRQLEDQLKDYRNQLTLALVELSKVESADGFEKLLNIVKGNDTKLESLTQATEHLRQAQLSVNNSPALVYFQQLLTLDSQARRAMYQDLILESLKFVGMYNRYEAIHSAHEDTFQWIFEPAHGDTSDNGSSYVCYLDNDTIKVSVNVIQDLVEILRQWTVQARGNLKLCVSSREEGVFMDEYASDPSFRLQDLTRFDMQDYVRSRLSSLKNEHLKNRFTQKIADKSSGIFLWVYLVVQTIRTKMSHRVSDEALEKHLETLPEGLKALFLHVLENLDPNDRIWTLRTIHLIRIAQDNDLELTLVASSLFGEYLKDPEFAVRDDIGNLENDEEVLRAQLRGACGGLIESNKSGRLGGLYALDYIHRSVPEMFQAGELGSDKLVRQMDAALNGVDFINALTKLSFASLRLFEHRTQD
ncbi:hypothetical protein ACHAPU_008212 [Fusarium lateritium]